MQPALLHGCGTVQVHHICPRYPGDWSIQERGSTKNVFSIHKLIVVLHILPSCRHHHPCGHIIGTRDTADHVACHQQQQHIHAHELCMWAMKYLHFQNHHHSTTNDHLSCLLFLCPIHSSLLRPVCGCTFTCD